MGFILRVLPQGEADWGDLSDPGLRRPRPQHGAANKLGARIEVLPCLWESGGKGGWDRIGTNGRVGGRGRRGGVWDQVGGFDIEICKKP